MNKTQVKASCEISKYIELLILCFDICFLECKLKQYFTKTLISDK